MDSFEQVVSEILWMEGYWVRTSVKVNLTKEEKVQIKKPSSPRWELDIVAYSGQKNELKIVECKSYLDSRGVIASAFGGSREARKDRFKLFNDANLRAVIFKRLKAQLFECGACQQNPQIRLCLAAGKIQKNNSNSLQKVFKANDWELMDQKWLKEKLELMAAQSYENQVSSVVAKLLVRNAIQ